MKTALYARVSSQAQADEDRVSIDEQFSEMVKRCNEKGYEVVARYRDIAPGSTRKRPSFVQMLEDAKAGCFDIIMCWKSDRLSRGIFPAAAIMEVIEATGLKLEAVVDHIDEKTFGIYAAVGKIEIDNFRERAALGKRGAAKRGKWPVGNLPYGYRAGEDGRPEINPEEAPFVAEIFKRYVELGHGSNKIADWLTLSDAPRRRGSEWGKWFSSQVLTTLSNPAYKGEGIYGKRSYRSTESGRRVSATDRKDWITVPFPPLVSEEIWQEAQNVKKTRAKRSRRNTRAVHLLQGLLHCDECGFQFSVINQKGNTTRYKGQVKRHTYARPLRYYKCGGMLNHRLDCREHSHVRADRLEELVWSEAVKILKRPEMVMEGLLADLSQPDREGVNGSLKHAETELRKVQAEEDRLIRLLVSDKITEPQFDRQRKFITERLEAARMAFGAARTRLESLDKSAELGDAVRVWAEQIRGGIDALTAAERQELLKLVLHRVSINREGRVKLMLAIPVADLIADEKRAS